MNPDSSGPNNIRMFPYLHTFKSVQIFMIFMSLIKNVKKIGTSGTSKVVPVTPEIKALGLDVKDSVVIALAVPGSEGEYALDLASSFTNPDVFYVNNRIMCSKDRYPNGQFIENRLNGKTSDDCRQALRRMTAMQDLIDVMREYTKNKVSGPCAYYNDELHSFVARFDPDDIEQDDDDSEHIRDLISRLDVLKACVESDAFGTSPLDSVKALGKDLDRALSDANALLDCPPENRNECCKHLNDVWNEEVNRIVYNNLYFVGCMIPFHMDDYPVCDCFPEFSVVPAPTLRMAKEKLQKIAQDGLSRELDVYSNVFGPYEDESECAEIVSYLKMKWKIEVGVPADSDTMDWVKNTVDRYNDLEGE